MKRASEYPPPFDSLTMLIYGEPGAGKTYFAGTFGNDVFYVNIGAGIATMYSPLFKNKFGEWNPYLFTPDRNSKTSTAVQVRDAIEEVLDAKDSNIHSIIIDDASALQNIMMLEAINYNFQTSKSQTKSQISQFGTFVPAIQDYGTEMSFSADFIESYAEACKSLQKNFIVLAHAKKEYKEQKGTTPPTVASISPAFTGKKNNIGANFDMVWYAMVDGAAGQERYQMRTQRNMIIEAKTRWGGIFPELYVNPTYEEIKHTLETYHTTGQLPSVGSLSKKR